MVLSHFLLHRGWLRLVAVATERCCSDDDIQSDAGQQQRDCVEQRLQRPDDHSHQRDHRASAVALRYQHHHHGASVAAQRYRPGRHRRRLRRTQYSVSEERFHRLQRVVVVGTQQFTHLIIIIIETFVTRLLQLKNEHKRYICYIKIYKIDKRIRTTVARPNEHYMLD